MEGSDRRKYVSSEHPFLLHSELFAEELHPNWESSQEKKRQKLIKTVLKEFTCIYRKFARTQTTFWMCKAWAIYL